MVEPINDIARQARQGSVSAIIQVLNDKLADSGVRTRAILDNKILQLLCEAPTLEQLEQSVLAERIRQILQSIQPRGIRRIRINSRIVREQQLLWLEEISRHPEQQLLWAEELTLAKENPLKRWLDDRQFDRAPIKPQPAKSTLSSTQTPQFWRGILGGMSLSLGLLAVGWMLSDRLGVEWMRQLGSSTNQSLGESRAVAVSEPTIAPQPDAFVQAVRIAEQAVIDGQTAQTATDWLDLATRWQRAADLMATVPANDSRYQTAQNRLGLYQQNSQTSLLRAEQLRPSTPP